LDVEALEVDEVQLDAAEQRLLALGGWMSRKILETYSHTRIEAKRQAIAVFDTRKLLREHKGAQRTVQKIRNSRKLLIRWCAQKDSNLRPTDS
jgi:hypothetical protein